MSQTNHTKPGFWIKIYTGFFVILTLALITGELDSFSTKAYLLWQVTVFFPLNLANIFYVTENNLKVAPKTWRVIFAFSILNYLISVLLDTSLASGFDTWLTILLLTLIVLPSFMVLYKLGFRQKEEPVHEEDILDDIELE